MIFGNPWIDEREISAVTEVLKSGWLSQGPKVVEFEEALRKYIGCDQVVAVSSCTAALALAVRSLGLKQGDKVLVPAMTFVATANVVLEAGFEVVFADCDPLTLNIQIPEYPDPKIKAVIPVHFAGRPCNMVQIQQAAEKHCWKIVEDAAHALGATYYQKMIGCSGNPVCFSFYPNKNLTTIEGGAIALSGPDSQALADRFRSERIHGLSKDAWKRFNSSNIDVTLMDSFGYKMNMTDVQAAVGLVQLSKFDEIQRRRTKIWQTYMKNLKNLPFILPKSNDKDSILSPHLFVIIHQDGLRNRLREFLAKNDIATGIHYVPVHKHPFYQERYKDVNCPYSEFVGLNCLSLPLSATMSEKDVDTVIQKIKEFYCAK